MCLDSLQACCAGLLAFQQCRPGWADQRFVQVALAQQIYDYVDQRIRRLDKDIKVFDVEIGKQRSLLGLPVRSCCPPTRRVVNPAS